MILFAASFAGAYWWQTRMLNHAVASIKTAKKFPLNMKNTSVKEIPDDLSSWYFRKKHQDWQKIRNDSVYLTFPDWTDEKLRANTPQALWKRGYGGFGNYLILTFNFPEKMKNKIEISIHQKNHVGIVPIPTIGYRNQTCDFSEVLELPVAEEGKYILVIPVYFSTTSSFAGIDMPEKIFPFLQEAYAFSTPGDMFAHVRLWTPDRENSARAIITKFNWKDVLQLHSARHRD